MRRKFEQTLTIAKVGLIMPAATVAAGGSRRPSESKFKQQKLPAWQPILTPKWVISCFTVVGAIFIPIGIAIMMASRDVSHAWQRVGFFMFIRVY